MIRRQPQSRAFSIAELLLVIMIISTLSAVAIVSYSQSFRGKSLRQSAEKVKSVLVQARTQAIADNQPTQVVFDLDNNQFWIDRLNNGGTDVSDPKIVPPEGLGGFVTFGDLFVNGISQTTGYVAAQFAPDGKNPLVTVQLVEENADPNADENYYSVRLWPNSGIPKVNARERLQ